MRAVVLERFGGPEVLQPRDVARPVPGAQEALVRIRCCGVCHLDLILRSGMRSRVKPPRIIGHELAGEVVEVGTAVTDLAAGERVASFNFQACGQCAECRRGRPSLCRDTKGDIGQTRDGGYAEYAVLDRRNLVRVPAGMPLEHACLAACVYAPPYKALRRAGGVERGQSIVVTGASGGLGLATLQLARALGARTIAITGSEAKAARLAELGADEVVVSADGAFGAAVRELTGGRGVDLVVELIGSPTFHGALRSLAPGGRIAVIGELHGKPVEINLGLLILKEWEIFGIQSASGPDLVEVLAFMHTHRIEPPIWKTRPLEQAADAHRELAGRDVVGRTLLKP